MLSGLLSAVPRRCLPAGLRTAARVQARYQCPKQARHVQSGHSSWTGGRREKNNGRMKRGEEQQGRARKSRYRAAGGGGGEGEGEMEAGREAEKKRWGEESEPQENVRHTLDREEEE